MNTASLILLGLCFLGLFLHVAMWISTYIKIRRMPYKDSQAQKHLCSSDLNAVESLTGCREFTPPVSVLKPLSGAEPGLFQNLASFCQLDYPSGAFELVFGVQRADDPALVVLDQLREAFPHVRMKVVMTSAVNIGYNPKINNLVGMVPEAAHEFMVISDSNVRVSPDYLKQNIAHFANPQVGLVTNVIRATSGKSAGSLFEGLHMNSFVMGSVCLSDLLANITVVVGKSIFFRRSQMNQLGGLHQFANYLAEDYLMGEAYADAGFEVRLSGMPVDTVTSSWTMRQFINRHTRWAQLRWNINRAAYGLELVCNFSFWALVMAASAGFSGTSVGMMALLWLVKIAGDMTINRHLGRPLPGLNYLLMPIKDIVIALIFPRPVFSSRTKWRGTSLRVSKRSLLVPVR